MLLVNSRKGSDSPFSARQGLCTQPFYALDQGVTGAGQVEIYTIRSRFCLASTSSAWLAGLALQKRCDRMLAARLGAGNILSRGPHG